MSPSYKDLARENDRLKKQLAEMRQRQANGVLRNLKWPADHSNHAFIANKLKDQSVDQQTWIIGLLNELYEAFGTDDNSVTGPEFRVFHDGRWFGSGPRDGLLIDLVRLGLYLRYGHDDYSGLHVVYKLTNENSPGN